jgi:Type ISP C-terminal specificity domain/N-6 DNA Methylase
VLELLATDSGLQDLARDWRELLFPEADDRVFADGYAQTVTFALLVARVEEIDFGDGDLGRIADQVGKRHGLIGTALDVLTNPRPVPKFAVSLRTLVRVLAVVDWPTISRGDPEKWLLFYEDFLQEYDPVLRRATGSYYTPVAVADAMARMVDGLLRTRLGRRDGFAAPDVTVVHPAMGTGTFLFRIIERIAQGVEGAEGAGAVPARLREATRRLVGFEIQTGPFAVAEFRLDEELRRREASIPDDGFRIYVTDTLGDPYAAEHRLAAVYQPIARSRRRANQVKADEPVVVVIGNPPYRERSRGRGGWIEKGNPDTHQPAPLLEFMPLREWGLGAHVKHLYNPYVYFWRWATWKVFERHPADRGVVALITVAGFLNGPGFAGMRSYLRRFADAVWVIDLPPEGHQPEVVTRVFAGVQQPVCITIAVRDGSTDDATPAPVLHREIVGRQSDKFEALSRIELDDASWASCPTAWAAPFLPSSAASWNALPALADLMPWSGSGTMPGRTWVVAPLPGTLRARWAFLVGAPADEKARLFREHQRDRRVDRPLRDSLPGYPTTDKAIGEETGLCPEPTRIAYRSLDRQWIIPDKRLINQPNPSLWAVRSATQVYLTALHATSPSGGPAASFSGFVPDLDHYHGRGGRAFPLWRDASVGPANRPPSRARALVTANGRPHAGAAPGPFLRRQGPTLESGPWKDLFRRARPPASWASPPGTSLGWPSGASWPTRRRRSDGFTIAPTSSAARHDLRVEAARRPDVRRLRPRPSKRPRWRTIRSSSRRPRRCSTSAANPCPFSRRGAPTS